MPHTLGTSSACALRRAAVVVALCAAPCAAPRAAAQDVGPEQPLLGFNQGSFRFGSGARAALTVLWAESVSAREERVACIGGYQAGGVAYITRIAFVVPAPGDGKADSMHIPAAASLRQCGAPEWLGTVHTHIATFQGQPFVTFSGADRTIMAMWNRLWHANGVFCVLYSDHEAHCEAGAAAGEPLYAIRGEESRR